jgi:hypothetical protein
MKILNVLARKLNFFSSSLGLSGFRARVICYCFVFCEELRESFVGICCFQLISAEIKIVSVSEKSQEETIEKVLLDFQRVFRHLKKKYFGDFTVSRRVVINDSPKLCFSHFVR